MLCDWNKFTFFFFWYFSALPYAFFFLSESLYPLVFLPLLFSFTFSSTWIGILMDDYKILDNSFLSVIEERVF